MGGREGCAVPVLREGGISDRVILRFQSVKLHVGARARGVCPHALPTRELPFAQELTL
jgi:hypothetical protein